ncbi:MAG: class I SAM-dependent RNA methyltransferase [Smithella sp.]
MQIRDRITIKIERIAFGGEGVGRIDNFVVFVPFSAPDDELEVEITQCKKKFARGKILKIINASPLRVKPLCHYYAKCGGCCYQHISYDQQLEIKKRQVEEAFIKIGRISMPPVLPVVASETAYHYRGKAQCHQIMTSSGLKTGFLDTSGGFVVDIERCEIMDETINEKIGRLRKNPLNRSKKTDTRLTIWSDLPNEHNTKRGQVRRVVKGKEFLVPFDGFFQNNLFLTDALVDEVCRTALSGQLNSVIDVYCGCGLFSIFLAPFAGEVFGIELNEKAVKFAQINAEKENLGNVKFVRGDAGEELLKGKFLSPAGTPVNLLLLDPPRVGCSQSVLKAIAGLHPQRIIYVSCNPVTQARDVHFLNESGYKLLSLQPFDMFPQTQHVEVIALLESEYNLSGMAINDRRNELT